MVSQLPHFQSSHIQLTRTDKLQATTSDIALILGALTAGGGVTGYVRTGSVPSIAAGLTVGALVRVFLPSFQLGS